MKRGAWCGERGRPSGQKGWAGAPARYSCDGLSTISHDFQSDFPLSPISLTIDPRLANATGETPVVRGIDDARVNSACP